MMDELQVQELRTILNAFDPKVVNEALKLHGRIKRGRRTAEKSGWLLWERDDVPPRPYEWRKVGNQVHYRLPPPEKQATVRGTKRAPSEIARSDRTAGVRHCPDCGADAFPQAVCPACAKGKAGIRKMYICGENSDHVFYTA